MKETLKKLSTLSFMLGSIGIGAGLLLFLPGLIASLFHVSPDKIGAEYLFGKFHPIYLRVFIFFSVFGLLLGIISRKFSKVGIVLSGIALLILLFWYFIYIGFSLM